jgi:hypothetical protein
MNLPPPTKLSNAEFVANLRIVLGDVCDALELDPATVGHIRDETLGLIIHSQGVEIFRRADAVDLATEELMVEIADELGKDDL